MFPAGVAKEFLHRPAAPRLKEERTGQRGRRELIRPSPQRGAMARGAVLLIHDPAPISLGGGVRPSGDWRGLRRWQRD